MKANSSNANIHPVRFTEKQVEFIKHIMGEHTFEEESDEIFYTIHQYEEETARLKGD